MYAFIKGTLVGSTPAVAILETHGVGYNLLVPPTYLSKLPPLGDEVTLYTSTVVRENFFKLYGFLSIQERELFETLIEVSGVGPKTALGVIGILSPSALCEAVRSGNILTITKVPGIGKKTAERLIMEVRDKLPSLIQLDDSDPVGMTGNKQTILDAINALVNLGYNQAAAQQAIKKTLIGMDEDKVQLPILITSALQHVR
ncbi:MAG: Holliday junction DNA helicase RuvA [Chlamydiales bacterium]|jgi:Holliday junction DNA helicase RuvA